MKQVDILLAVRNGAAFLEEQLHSLIGQSFRSIRVIVRDNASTDGTPALLKEWQARFPEVFLTFYGERDLGVVGNFRALLELSSAPYVMFCDSDDVWMAEKVEKTLRAMQEKERERGRETPILVHTDLVVVDEKLEPIHSSYWRHARLFPASPFTLNRALAENSVSGCTAMINRALADLAGPLPLEAPMHDAWIALVASAFGDVESLQEASILYRQHGGNDSGASKYGLFSSLKSCLSSKKREKIREVRRARREQARLFLQRYEQRLSPEQRELVEAYLSLSGLSWMKRFALLRRRSLFESGGLRRLYQLFSSTKKREIREPGGPSWRGGFPE